jgi:hypothetical protein
MPKWRESIGRSGGLISLSSVRLLRSWVAGWSALPRNTIGCTTSPFFKDLPKRRDCESQLMRTKDETRFAHISTSYKNAATRQQAV